MTLWANPLIDRATAPNDFDLRRFRREPQSLYIAIAPDDLQHLAPLGTLGLDDRSVTRQTNPIDNLVALIPPPRRHRHRYHWVLAPNAP